MKIRATLKDPDALSMGIEMGVEREYKDKNKKEGYSISREEIWKIREERHEQFYELFSKWFDCGEYLTVEIDTDLGTIRVLERNE